MSMNSNLPGTAHAAITIGTAFDQCRSVYVGVGGDVSATVNGVTVVYKNVPSGTFLPIRAVDITTANTTATNLVAIY